MKQTPVEWLEDALFKIHGSSTDMNGTSKFLEKEFKELFVQAKEMEKQQGYSEEDLKCAWNSSDQNMRFQFSSSAYKAITFKQWLENFKE